MRIAALGAGRMGRGIGLVFAYAGYRVDVVDFKPRPAAEAARLRQAALEEIGATLSMLAAAGMLPESDRPKILSRVRALSFDEAAEALGAADVIFEGVTETLEAKRDAFQRACQHAREDAIIASTTSSMLADALAGLVSHPQRFINTHFLNPAYLIPLVEVSPAKATDEGTFRRMRALLESAGKVVVRCAPSPGFIVPRLQAAAMNEAARLVEEGVATPEDIDRAVRSGFGPRYEPPAIVERLMSQGKRGAREGEGLYDWRGRDLAAYQRELVGRYVALFSHLGLLPAPGAVDRLRGPGSEEEQA